MAPPVASAGPDLRAPDGTAIDRVTADCSGAANQVVSQTGGQLLSAAAQTKGGQVVCVITVLVPGKGNERPKKVSVSVPQ
ncbi:hypothetical protein [Hoeflea sp. YIM 152468]|uniref:hypothetical protein n=1 Tax=Hoeflea sp. YIM 152468 TaxID=3031759 RepID=UPI0031B83E7E